LDIQARKRPFERLSELFTKFLIPTRRTAAMFSYIGSRGLAGCGRYAAAPTDFCSLNEVA
jgi:hypothetical protein